MFKHYKQSNGLFHAELPSVHWVSPQARVSLTAENAADYGYLPAENSPHEYGLWLIESGWYLQNVINATYENMVLNLVKATPATERESWPKQEQEAKAYTLDAQAATPYVDSLALNRNVPREILLSKILEKVALYEVAHSTLTGQRQAKEDALNALDRETVTHEDVFAIGWAQ